MSVTTTPGPIEHSATTPIRPFSGRGGTWEGKYPDLQSPRNGRIPLRIPVHSPDAQPDIDDEDGPAGE